MKLGASVSGGLHTAFVVLAVWGIDWFSPADETPFTVTEIELVDGTEFEAALSTAPVVPSEGPAELSEPAEPQTDAGEVDQPDDQTEQAEAPVAATAPPPDPKPEALDLQIPPPPTNVPTEAPLPTIAEIPSPDVLPDKAAEPESPAATTPVAPLKSLDAPRPSAKPTPPPPPEPEPEQAEPEPEQAPQEETPEAVAEKQPEPEPEEKPEETDVAEAQPEAPDGEKPQEARLPVAKPAKLAAAAEAARKAEQAAQEAAEAKERERVAAAKPDPAKPATPAKPAKPSGSTSTLAAKLSRGERDALRIGIKKYYTYSGDRSDRSLQVVIRVKLDQSGTPIGNPVQRSAKGGTAQSQKALFDAGRRAILRAARAGEFKRLPADKYQRWKVLNFRFSTDKIGVAS